MSMQTADDDVRFAHNALTGATNLWDDPTIDARGNPQREVRFDNGVIHTQYDPSINPMEIQKTELNTYDNAMPTLTRDDTVGHRNLTPLTLARNNIGQLTTMVGEVDTKQQTLNTGINTPIETLQE